MSVTSDANSGLGELQRLAQEYNERLIAEFPNGNFSLGGNLFLGKHYCESSRIFLGLNPGREDPGDFKTDLLEWNFWDCADSGYAYWNNCRFFVNAAEGLHDWITSATVAFCCPWRTQHGKRLRGLNAETNGRLLEYSGELVRRLIQDHRRVGPQSRPTLLAAGRESLKLLSDPGFLHFDWFEHQKYHNGATRTYQWARIEWDGLVIYQVPHFSRAGSKGRLTECAEWLALELKI